jgi:isoamylase
MAKNSTPIDFSYHAPDANRLSINLFDPTSLKKISSHPLKKTGPKFTGALQISNPELLYKLEIDGNIFFDPFSKALKMSPAFNRDSDIYSQFTFDFTAPKFTQAPKIDPNNLIIYEMHLRGFTQSTSSGIKNKGGFLGFIEKIPYLKSLGINAVQIMPIMAFNPADHPKNKTDGLVNYWGYNTLNFFALMSPYASNHNRLTPLQEFTQMVEALHQAGIAIILDVVYNHTSTQCRLDLLAKKDYYILSEGQHTNYTGCGNTINANTAASKDLIINSLTYFAKDLNVDGFRFDLASALTRGTDGTPLKNPPLIHEIQEEPTLKNKILIAEPWDTGGLYEPGSFCGEKFLQHNGPFRDTIRKAIVCDQPQTNLKTMLEGSFDQSLNFTTCHDGFTLNDLVSYNTKHNEKNLEEGQDGSDINFSNNCAIEGPTSDPQIQKLREHKALVVMALTILSKGPCMLRMGDEYLHTTKGNNNAYCHDTELNYFDWNKLEKRQPFLQMIQTLIAIKKEGPVTIETCNNQSIELQGPSKRISIDLQNYGVSIFDIYRSKKA